MRGIGRDGMMKERLGGNHDSLRFGKTGKEIQDSIKKKITIIGGEIEENQKEIGTICKVRGLEIQEVLEASDDDKIEAYSSKAFSNAGNPKQGDAIRELQADIDKLRTLTFGIQRGKGHIEALERISNNIEVTRKFELTYDDLLDFGF